MTGSHSSSVVFICGPADVREEREALGALVTRLARQTRRPIQPYLWELDDVPWSASEPWQDQIRRRVAHNAAATICVFGERIGSPLPRSVGLSLDRTHDWFQHIDLDRCGSRDQIPCSGTVFEALDAASRVPPRPLLLIARGGPRTLDASVIAANRRGFGNGRLYRRLMECYRSPEQSDDLAAAQDDYRQQIESLRRWYDLVVNTGWPVEAVDGPVERVVDIAERWLMQYLALPAATITSNPYRLLDRYEIEDASVFFGRDSYLGRFTEILGTQARDLRPHIVVVHGHSGTGKSSFLRAGIGAWAISHLDAVPVVFDAASFAGDDDPVCALAHVIASALGDGALDVHGTPLPAIVTALQAERRARFLVDALTAVVARTGARRLVFLVDQFEQVLASREANAATRSPSAPQSLRWDGFLDVLAELARGMQPGTTGDNGTGDRIRIVIAVPTSWYADLRALVDTWNRADRESPGIECLALALEEPNEADVRQIIEGPLRRAGAVVGEDFIQCVLAEKRRFEDDSRGSVLAVLSAAMARVYEAWFRDPRQRDHMPPAAAISGDAAEITAAKFGSLVELTTIFEVLGSSALAIATPHDVDDELRDSVHRLFRHLVKGMGEGRPVLAFLATTSATFADLHASVIEPLLRNRLLREVERAGVRTVELAHATVLSSWSVARSWLERNGALLEARVKLQQAAQRWIENGKPPPLLAYPREADSGEALMAEWGDDLVEDVLREFVIASLQRLWSPDRQVNTKGISHLNLAIRGGAPELAGYYLDNGGDPDLASAASGTTPLMTAAHVGDEATLRTLLVRGGRIDLVDKTGNTAVMFAAASGSIGCLEALDPRGEHLDCQNAAGSTALAQAVGNGRLEAVEWLVGRGAIIELADTDGFTPLARAAGLGRADILRTLEARGARRDVRVAAGWTPLMLAAANGRTECLDLLLGHIEPSQLEAVTDDGRTAAMLAFEARAFDCAVRLLQAGASILPRRRDGDTILAVAIATPQEQFLSAILRHAKEREVLELLHQVDGKRQTPAMSLRNRQVAGRADLICEWIRTRSPVEPTTVIPDLEAADDESVHWIGIPQLARTATVLRAEDRRSWLTRLHHMEREHGYPETFLAETVLSVRSTELAFYPDLLVIDVVTRGAEPSSRRLRGFILAKATSKLLAALDAIADPIYALNERWLRLSGPDDVASYLKFFFRYVLGSEGSVELLDEPERLLGDDQAELSGARFGAATASPTMDGFPVRWSGLIYYGGGVISTTIECTRSGRLAFQDQQMALDGTTYRWGWSAPGPRDGDRRSHHLEVKAGPNDDVVSPLALAMALGRLDAVEQLARTGEPSRKEYVLAWRLAMWRRDHDVMRHVLRSAPDATFAGLHVLAAAVDTRDVAVVEACIEGLSPEACENDALQPDHEGVNAVQRAAELGAVDIYARLKACSPAIAGAEAMRLDDVHRRFRVCDDDPALDSAHLGTFGAGPWRLLPPEPAAETAWHLLTATAGIGRLWLERGATIAGVRTASLSFFPELELVEVVCRDADCGELCILTCACRRGTRELVWLFDGMSTRRCLTNLFEQEALFLSSPQEARDYARFMFSTTNDPDHTRLFPDSPDDLAWTPAADPDTVARVRSAWAPLALCAPHVEVLTEFRFEGTHVCGAELVSAVLVVPVTGEMAFVRGETLQEGLPLATYSYARNLRRVPRPGRRWLSRRG